MLDYCKINESGLYKVFVRYRISVTNEQGYDPLVVNSPRVCN